MIRPLLVFALLLLATPSVAEDLPLTYESAEHGFRLRHPAGWSPNRRTGPAGSWIIQFNDQVSGVLVEVTTPEEPRKPRAIRDGNLRKVARAPGYENPRAVSGLIAGREAPGVEVLLTQGGRKWRLRQLYLVHEGSEITFQTFALADSWDARQELFDRFRAGFALVPVAKEAKETALLRRLAARCGSDLAWASTWPEATRRAKKEGKLVLVYVRRLGGFAITDPAMAGLFMDDDVQELIRKRLVPHRLPAGSKAPFVSPDVYGLSRSTFGSALLVVSPEGRVLAETFSLETMSAYAFLRRVLGIGPDPDLEAELEEGGDHLALARILALRREGDAALARLHVASEAGQDEDAIRLLRAEVLMRLGRFRDAAREAEGVATSSSARPRALLLLAALRLRIHGVDEGVATYREIVKKHPESREARRAAAALLGTGLRTGAHPRLRWLPDDLLGSVRPPKPERLTTREARRARREAREIVLDAQRRDGSWACPVLIGRAEDGPPHAFTIATTALCATSLLPDRDAPRAKNAIRRAFVWLGRAHTEWQRKPPPVHFMDYSVWARAAHLRLLARRPYSKPLANEIVAELRRLQRPGGGFSYYVTRDLEGKTKDTQSISFVTAYAALALLDAKKAGLAVPEDFLASVLDGLAAMRNPNGTFSYMKPPGVRTPDGTREPGAAGRGPLCALALLRGGRADLDLVRKTLAIFARHREELGAQRRKALMHTGSDGQGSHYLMFDYATIAEAIAALPEAERDAHRKILIEEILACRLADGSYLDNPFLGRAFGAAQALAAFESLGVPR